MSSQTTEREIIMKVILFPVRSQKLFEGLEYYKQVLSVQQKTWLVPVCQQSATRYAGWHFPSLLEVLRFQCDFQIKLFFQHWLLLHTAKLILTSFLFIIENHDIITITGHCGLFSVNPTNTILLLEMLTSAPNVDIPQLIIVQIIVPNRCTIQSCLSYIC